MGFQWLPVPPSGYVSGYTFKANAISGDGSTAVGSINQPGGIPYNAWKWTAAGGLVLLSTNGITGATAVNTNGSVIVGNYGTDPESLGAASWNASGTETILSPAQGYEAYGVNGSGNTIVGGGGAFNVPVTWTSGGDGVPLITSASYGSASCISANGSVIAGYYNGGTFKWVSGSLYTLNGATAAAQGISADGSIIVGQESSLAAVWAGGGGGAQAQYLTTPLSNQFSGMAYAANQNGTVVVGANTSSGSQAFIWTLAAGAQPVSSVVSGAPSNLAVATGISSDGKTVVGYSSADANNTIKAWIAYLP